MKLFVCLFLSKSSIPFGSWTVLIFTRRTWTGQELYVNRIRETQFRKAHYFCGYDLFSPYIVYLVTHLCVHGSIVTSLWKTTSMMTWSLSTCNLDLGERISFYIWNWIKELRNTNRRWTARGKQRLKWGQFLLNVFLSRKRIKRFTFRTLSFSSLSNNWNGNNLITKFLW